jgi:hypothetical protein
MYLLRVCLRNYLIGLVGFEPNGLPHCGDPSFNMARRFELLAICGKIREITGAPAWQASFINSFRAVAQLGRAPGSGE